MEASDLKRARHDRFIDHRLSETKFKIRKSLFVAIGAVAAVIFWFVDLPATVRIKTSILKLLPMDAETLDSSIYAVCAGTYVGMSARSCYDSFHSKEAAKVVEARERCRAFARKVEADKEWLRIEPNRDDKEQRVSYMYVGDDKAFHTKYGLALFFPDDCTMTSLIEGQAKIYKFWTDPRLKLEFSSHVRPVVQRLPQSVD